MLASSSHSYKILFELCIENTVCTFNAQLYRNFCLVVFENLNFSAGGPFFVPLFRRFCSTFWRILFDMPLTKNNNKALKAQYVVISMLASFVCLDSRFVSFVMFCVYYGAIHLMLTLSELHTCYRPKFKSSSVFMHSRVCMCRV